MPAGVMIGNGKPHHRIVVEWIARAEAHRLLKISNGSVRRPVPGAQKSPVIIRQRIVRVRLNRLLHHFKPAIEVQPHPEEIEAKSTQSEGVVCPQFLRALGQARELGVVLGVVSGPSVGPPPCKTTHSAAIGWRETRIESYRLVEIPPGVVVMLRIGWE